MPLLEITYAEQEVQALESDTKVEVDYRMDYFQESDVFLKTAMIVLIIGIVLVALAIAIRIFFFCKINPPSLLGASSCSVYASRIIYYICDCWATIMFYVAFFVNAYWFIMYKLQDNAHLLMPSARFTSAYDIFFYFFISILATKTAAIILEVVHQSTADIFVLDWEAPKPTES